jgi:hypothetical protein
VGGLPGGTPDFVGREKALTELRHRIEAHDATGTVVAIHAVDGMPGVGKTALAIHATHLYKDRYPGGQFFIDLHGYTPGVPPMTPEAALEELLRQTGMPEVLPRDLGSLQARWRSIMSRRQAIVLLDNVLDVNQVLPLLPMSASCLVLITSRPRLIALPGARSLFLDVLRQEEATVLFVRIVGQDRCQDLAMVAQVTRLVGQLPLAVEMVAGRMLADATMTVSELATDLAQTRQRLEEASPQDAGVRTAFSLSIAHMDVSLRQAFRMLGVHPGPIVGVPQFAAIAEISITEAARKLRALTEQNLITLSADLVGHRRYLLHDLVRDFAREEADTFVPSAVRSAAITRLTAWYKTAIEALERMQQAGGTEITTPTGLVLNNPAGIRKWLISEQSNMLALAEVATDDDASLIVAEFARWLFLLSFSMDWPRQLAIEFTKTLKLHSDTFNTQMSPEQMREIFNAEYLDQGPIALLDHFIEESASAAARAMPTLVARIRRDGIEQEFRGSGRGPISAFCAGLDSIGIRVRVVDYAEHAMRTSDDAEAPQAVAYVKCEIGDAVVWGVGVSSNTSTASLRAILSAVKRSHSHVPATDGLST